MLTISWKHVFILVLDFSVHNPYPKDLFTHTHTHIFYGVHTQRSMWAKQTTRAGVDSNRSPTVMHCGGSLHISAWLDTACRVHLSNSVSCTESGIPRWCCVIARYLHAEIVQNKFVLIRFCMRISQSMWRKWQEEPDSTLGYVAIMCS